MSGDALRAAVLRMMAYGTARSGPPISTMENLKNIMNAAEKLIHKNEAFVYPDGAKTGRDKNQLLKAQCLVLSDLQKEHVRKSPVIAYFNDESNGRHIRRVSYGKLVSKPTRAPYFKIQEAE